jgi:hypothetical protein
MDSKNVLSIWLVVGISLLVNGVLIFGAGIYEWMYPPVQKVALFQYHASVWWGALLTVIGLIYCIRFAPGRQKAALAAAATAAGKEIHGK